MATQPRPLADMSDTGLLWYINKAALHPRGFALALHYAKDGKCEGWSIIGDGAESWVMGEHINEDEKFAAMEALLQEARDAGG